MGREWFISLLIYKNMKLYHHKTDGGAEYLMDKFILCPNGEKEGVMQGAKYIVRIDGDITKDAELFINKDNQNKKPAWNTKAEYIKDHTAIKKQIKEWELVINNILDQYPDELDKLCIGKKTDTVLSELEYIYHEMFTINL